MDRHHGWYVSAKPLIIGTIASLLLLFLTYWVALSHVRFAALLLILFASLQAGVQLFFFMHLGVEEKPRWNLISFILLILVMIIIIGGSAWIMYELDYNVMPTMGP